MSDDSFVLYLLMIRMALFFILWIFWTLDIIVLDTYRVLICMLTSSRASQSTFGHGWCLFFPSFSPTSLFYQYFPLFYLLPTFRTFSISFSCFASTLSLIDPKRRAHHPMFHCVLPRASLAIWTPHSILAPRSQCSSRTPLSTMVWCDLPTFMLVAIR